MARTALGSCCVRTVGRWGPSSASAGVNRAWGHSSEPAQLLSPRSTLHAGACREPAEPGSRAPGSAYAAQLVGLVGKRGGSSASRPTGVYLEGRAAYRPGKRWVRVGSGQGHQHLNGPRVAAGPDFLEQLGY